ncbi:MAG: hypothetical protein D6812_06700, partial [Deltaproteobacteria bacterium]
MGVLFLLLGSGRAVAFLPPDPSPLQRAGEEQEEAGHEGDLFLAPEPFPNGAGGSVAFPSRDPSPENTAALRAFERRYGGTWHARWREGGTILQSLEGSGVPIGPTGDRGRLIRRVRRFLEENEDLLQVPAGDLFLRSVWKAAGGRYLD